MLKESKLVGLIKSQKVELCASKERIRGKMKNI